MIEQNLNLTQIISNEIRERGSIPFSRYMELCLYHPVLGYYQRQEPITGPSGDFYTAPHVHSLFGRTIGAWIKQVTAGAGWEKVSVLELGPGNGQLARDILDHWDHDKQPISFILIEEAGPRRRDLEARFADDPVHIIGPEELDTVEPFMGVVIANEFFDALPLRVFTRSEELIKEVFVDTADDGFKENLVPVEIQGRMAQVLEVLPEGFRTEVSDLWETWFQKICAILVHGQLLILDYGESTEGLIVPWRESGSLRCYHRHHVDNNPYDLPGEKDITAHVNFSLLRQWGEDAGLTFRTLISQSSFLIKGGILEMLAQTMDGLPERDATGLWLTVKNLIHEEGMGEVFKAMVMEK